jgi:hypothetical protein
MTEFDPQHGPAERGTAGHRASAEVADVAAEVAALDRIHASLPYEDAVDARFAAKLAAASFWQTSDDDPVIDWDSIDWSNDANH